MSNREKHIVQYDVLRIIAIMMVIFNHTKQYGYELYAATDRVVSYWGSVFLAFLSKAGVPLFLMVSGALLLGRTESVSKVLKKRVLPFFAIMAVMFFLQYLRLIRAGAYEGFSPLQYVRFLLYENPIAPYWFLRSYLIFLITLPFLRPIAQKLDKELFCLLLVLALLTSVLRYLNLVFDLPNSLTFFPLDSFLFYPLIGYYLSVSSNYEAMKSRFLILAVVLVSLGETLFAGMMAKKTGGAEPYFELVWIIAIGLFILICRIKHFKMTRLLPTIGGCVFGVYLIEDIVRNQLAFLVPKLSSGLGELGAVCFYVIAVFAVSCFVVWVGKKIPGIRFLFR